MNLATFIVLSILIVVVVLIIKTLQNDKKNGKSSCGGDCGGCGNDALCHSSKNLFQEYQKELHK